MTTTNTTTETKAAPVGHAWAAPTRGIIPRLPAVELLRGRAAELKAQIVICVEAKAQADREVTECRQSLGSAEANHRRAIAEAVRTGEALPDDPIPSIEAKLSEAERMSEAYRIAATDHFLDLGDCLVRTDAAVKGIDAASRRIDSMETRVSKLLGQLDVLTRDLATQRALRSWYMNVSVRGVAPKWADSALGHKEVIALKSLADVLDVEIEVPAAKGGDPA